MFEVNLTKDRWKIKGKIGKGCYLIHFEGFVKVGRDGPINKY